MENDLNLVSSEIAEKFTSEIGIESSPEPSPASRDVGMTAPHSLALRETSPRQEIPSENSSTVSRILPLNGWSEGRAQHHRGMRKERLLIGNSSKTSPKISLTSSAFMSGQETSAVGAPYFSSSSKARV